MQEGIARMVGKRQFLCHWLVSLWSPKVMKLSCKIQLVLLVQSVSVNLTLLCGLLVTPELIVMAPSVLCRWVRSSETKGITQHERSRPEVAGMLCFLDVFTLVLGTRDRLMAHWKPFVLFVGDLAVWNDPCTVLKYREARMCPMKKTMGLH